tara:strand:- start:217 stop:456 length:240 start_codon:yes stop_codon:yes gene_type:complete
VDEEVVMKTNKLEKLQLKMIRYAESKRTPLPNGSGYILPNDWSEDFKWVLQLESKSTTLSSNEMKKCNKLFRKYLGFVK